MIKEDKNKKKSFIDVVREANNVDFSNEDKSDSINNVDNKGFKDIVNEANPNNFKLDDKIFTNKSNTIKVKNDKNVVEDENIQDEYAKTSDTVAFDNERINQVKNKKEVDSQIEKAKVQGVSSKLHQPKDIIDRDVKIGLASPEETKNAQELSISDIQAMGEAIKKNENIEKGGVEAFNEFADTVLNNIFYGLVKKPIASLINVGSTAIALGIRGLEGATGVIGLEDASNNLNDAYNSVVDFGSDIKENADYESTVTDQIDNDFVRTSGKVSDVISNMIGNAGIGYVLGIPGAVVQGLGVGGSSAQEVLDENKNNIGQATVTGIAKGYVSYLTEKMFDANIVTRGTKKSSIQEGINRIISNRINSKLGKEVANRFVGIVGENVEEFTEDNAGYLIDRLVNNKELPDFEQWWNNTTETTKITTLSTMIMGLLGLGGESFSDIEMDMETKYWTDQAQQIIEKEDLAIHFDPKKVKSLNQSEQFYITSFGADGKLAKVVPTKGKLINNTRKDLNISPVIIKDGETNLYNVIDGNTGVVLNNTYYESVIEAKRSFDEQINKLTDLQVKDINDKINEANYLITDTIMNTISEARKQLIQNNFEDNTSILNKNYTEQQFNDISKLMRQISDKSVYSNDNVSNLFKVVSDNVKGINLVEQNGMKFVNSLDKDGNIVYQQKLDNKKYSGAKLKEVLNNAIINSDLSNIQFENNNLNMHQTFSEQNPSTFYANKTNYAIQDTKKVIEAFNVQDDYTIDEMAKIWNDDIVENSYDVSYDENGNIQNYIAIEEEGDNIYVSLYDNEDNLINREVISNENGKYSSEDITNAIEKVSRLYDENRPIKGQIDVEGNEVRSLKKSKTPHPKQKQFNEIISNAINDKTAKGSMSIAKVNQRVADRIEKITGINTLNRQEKVSASDIRHILNQHGNEKIETTKGQLAVTESDIKKIPDVIENFDRIIKGSIHKDRNGKHQTVRFIKKYDNNTLYVVEVVPNKGKTLTIKTMWKKPIGLNHGNNTLHHTPKAKANVRKIHIY